MTCCQMNPSETNFLIKSHNLSFTTNAFEDVVCKSAAISFRPQHIKTAADDRLNDLK